MKLTYYLNRLSRLFGSKREAPQNPTTGNPGFIVYNPTWPDPPRYWFSSAPQATRAAEMLASEQPQDTFYVMKAILVVTAKPTTQELPSGPETT